MDLKDRGGYLLYSRERNNKEPIFQPFFIIHNLPGLSQAPWSNCFCVFHEQRDFPHLQISAVYLQVIFYNSSSWSSSYITLAILIFDASFRSR